MRPSANRLHLGHTKRSLTPGMAPFVFGTRFDMCLIDLDQTAQLLRYRVVHSAADVPDSDGGSWCC